MKATRALSSIVLLGASTALSGQHFDCSFNKLVEHSAQRIALAHQIALAKWDSGAAVEDFDREMQVIQHATTIGRAKGLSNTVTSSFFRDQIEANKVVQYSLFSDWHRIGATPNHSPQNLSAIRIELDRLQGVLIADLVETFNLRSQPGCATAVAASIHQFVSKRGTSDTNLETIALKRALGSVCIP